MGIWIKLMSCWSSVLTLCNKKLGIGVGCLLRSTSCQWFFKSMNQNKEPPEGQWWGCLSWWPDHWAESILSLPLTFAAIIVNAPKKRLFSLSLTGKIMQEANHLSNTARQESGPSSERTLSHNAVPVNWVNWLGSKFQHCVSHFQSCALCFIRNLQKVIAQISHFLQACRASEFTCPVEWLGDVWFTMIHHDSHRFLPSCLDRFYRGTEDMISLDFTGTFHQKIQAQILFSLHGKTVI